MKLFILVKLFIYLCTSVFIFIQLCFAFSWRIYKFLCNNDWWKYIEKNELIQNLSNTLLKTVEQEPLQFGLRFDSGINDLNIENSINLNSDTDSDFNFVLPKRHIAVLRDLSDYNIIISPSDKDKDVVIMNTTHYNNKIMELLNDKNTYGQIFQQTINKNIDVWGLKDFYGSQWLRARLCCRKISDSILFSFTPRWLGRCNALPKEGP